MPIVTRMRYAGVIEECVITEIESITANRQ